MRKRDTIIEDLWKNIRESGGDTPMTGAEIIAQMWAEIAEVDAERRQNKVLRCIEAELVELPEPEGNVSLLQSIEDFLPMEKKWFKARAKRESVS